MLIPASKRGAYTAEYFDMFTYADRNSNSNQTLSFVFSLGLQSAVLILLCCLPYPRMSGASFRHTAVTARTVTPIYFQKETITPVAEPAREAAAPTPKVQPEKPSPTTAETESEGDATASQAGDQDSQGDDSQGIAPFPSWRMNAAPTSFSMFHHVITTALPVFTPDPPILHGTIPESLRGKDLVLDVIINDQGSIAQVKVVQGVGNGIEESIMETLRRWIFVPAKVNGYAIASRRQIRFHFPG